MLLSCDIFDHIKETDSCFFCKVIRLSHFSPSCYYISPSGDRILVVVKWTQHMFVSTWVTHCKISGREVWTNTENFLITSHPPNKHFKLSRNSFLDKNRSLVSCSLHVGESLVKFSFADNFGFFYSFIYFYLFTYLHDFSKKLRAYLIDNSDND